MLGLSKEQLSEKTLEEWQKLADEYGQYRLGRMLNVDGDALYKQLFRRGIVFNRHRKAFMDISSEEIIEKYLKHKSIEPLIEEYGVGRQMLYKKIPKEIINFNYARKYDFNHSFFKQDSFAAFYWAGFILADGNVSEKRKTLKIAIKNTDRLLLEKFKVDIGYTGDIKEYPTIYGSLAEIQLYSEEMYDDLAKFGVIPRKTYNCTIPDWIKSHEFCRAYILGLADGDGSISRINDGATFIFSLIGGQSEIEKVKEIIECYVPDVIGHGTAYLSKKTKNMDMWSYVLSWRPALIKLRNWLYHDHGYGLERKKGIFYNDDIYRNKNICPVRATNLSSGESIDYTSKLDAVKRGGFNMFSINHILNGNRRQHKGFHFTKLTPPDLRDLANVIPSPIQSQITADSHTNI